MVLVLGGGLELLPEGLTCVGEAAATGFDLAVVLDCVVTGGGEGLLGEGVLVLAGVVDGEAD